MPGGKGMPAVTLAIFSADVCSARQLFAVPGRTIHWPARHHDRRHIRTECSHEQSGSRLVAAAHQNGGINWIRAKNFFGFHRKEVAIVHRRRLHEGFAEPHDGDLDRETTGLPDAAFDVLRALPKMCMAGDQIIPCVQDANDWLSTKLVRAEPSLLLTRSMAEGSQVIWSQVSMTLEFFWCQSLAIIQAH